MVIGHNPGISAAAISLAPEAITNDLPTCGTLTMSVSCADLESHRPALRARLRARLAEEVLRLRLNGDSPHFLGKGAAPREQERWGAVRTLQGEFTLAARFENIIEASQDFWRSLVGGYALRDSPRVLLEE